MHRYPLKLAAISTLCIYLTGLLPQAGAASFIRPHPQSGLPLLFPAGLASTEETRGENGSSIFHIQTIHGNYDAQKKVKDILKHLKEAEGVDLVLLEGSPFRLEPHLLLFYEDPEINGRILDDLAKSGIVKGAELFLSENPDVSAVGIEDLEAYNRNGRAFRGVLVRKQESLRFLEGLDLRIERMSSQFLNPRLYKFSRMREEYENGIIKIDRWLRYLSETAGEVLGIDFSDSANQIAWPMMTRLAKLQEFHAALAGKPIDQENRGFLRELKDLPETLQKEAAHLLLESENVSAYPGRADEVIEEFVSMLPADFNYGNYPGTAAYLGEKMLRDELKAPRLVKEAGVLSEMIAASLAGAEEEKFILQALAQYGLLKRLFSLTLTPADFRMIASQKDSIDPVAFAGRINAFIKERGLNLNELAAGEEIADLYGRALEFYEAVKARDPLMLANITRIMNETGKSKAAVITGGFHKEVFQNFFEERGCRYVSITPRVKNAEGRALYEQNTLKYLYQAEKNTYEEAYYVGTPAEMLIRQGVDARAIANESVIPAVAAVRRSSGIPEEVIRNELREIPYFFQFPPAGSGFPLDAHHRETTPRREEPVKVPTHVPRPAPPPERREDPSPAPAPREPAREPSREPAEVPAGAFLPGSLEDAAFLPPLQRSEIRSSDFALSFIQSVMMVTFDTHYETQLHLIKGAAEITGPPDTPEKQRKKMIREQIDQEAARVQETIRFHQDRMKRLVSEELERLFMDPFFTEELKEFTDWDYANLATAVYLNELFDRKSAQELLREVFGSPEPAKELLTAEIAGIWMIAKQRPQNLDAEILELFDTKGFKKGQPYHVDLLPAMGKFILRTVDLESVDLSWLLQWMRFSHPRFRATAANLFHRAGKLRAEELDLKRFYEAMKIMETSDKPLTIYEISLLLEPFLRSEQTLFTDHAFSYVMQKIESGTPDVKRTFLMVLTSFLKASPKYATSRTLQHILTHINVPWPYVESMGDAAMFTLSILLSQNPALRDKLPEYRTQIERLIAFSHGFSMALQMRDHGTGIMDMVTLGAKIGAGSSLKAKSPPGTDAAELAKWILRYKNMPGRPELQISVGYDTGNLLHQRDRAKFIALYLFIASTQIEEFYELTPRPSRDSGASFGLLIMGDEVIIKSSGQLRGKRLDYIFNLNESLSEGNLSRLLFQVKALNAGLLIASAQETYQFFFPKKNPSWWTQDMENTANLYRKFERDFVGLLRSYDRYRDPSAIYREGLNAEFHAGRETAFRDYRLEDVLYFLRPWLVPLYGEDDAWDRLLPYLRGIEGLMLHQGPGSFDPNSDAEEVPTVGREFINRTRNLGFEAAMAIKDAADGKLEETPASQMWDPFFDPAREEETTRYLRIAGEALSQGNFLLGQVSDPLNFFHFLKLYDIGEPRSELREKLPNTLSYDDPFAAAEQEAKSVPRPEAVEAERAAPEFLEPGVQTLPPAVRTSVQVFRGGILPLRYEAGGDAALTEILSALLGRQVHSGREAKRESVLPELLDGTSDVSSEAAARAVEAMASTDIPVPAKVLISVEWLRTLANDNPRSLFAILKGLGRAVEGRPEQRPLIAALGDEDEFGLLKNALLRKDSGLTASEKKEAAELFSRPMFARLIEWVAPESLETYAAENDYAVSFLFSGSEEDMSGLGSGFLVSPDTLNKKDYLSIAFLLPALMKAAAHVRGIKHPAERIKKLEEAAALLVPGAKKEGGRFVVEMTEFIERLILSRNLIDTAA